MGRSDGSANSGYFLNGQTQIMVGVIHKDIAYTPFQKAIKHNRKTEPVLAHLAEVLSSI